MRRVLITGSRYWPDPERVAWALNRELRLGPMIVIQGGATGADLQSKSWSERNNAAMFEQYDAEWDRPCDARCYHKPRKRKNGDPYCPLAGNYRNQKMVDLGAHKCIAFPLADSKGTFDCMKRAAKAGIEVLNLGWGGEFCCRAINYHNPLIHKGCILR